MIIIGVDFHSEFQQIVEECEAPAKGLCTRAEPHGTCLVDVMSVFCGR
jgi:hypothetical protein